MKAATIALVVRDQGVQDPPALVTTLSDDREITLLESAMGEGTPDPLKKVLEARDQQIQEENEFGDYIAAESATHRETPTSARACP